MKAISLWQPWASLIAWGYKKYETRHWYTSYRGELLICSAKKKQQDQYTCWLGIITVLETELNLTDHDFPYWDTLGFGCAIAVVNLTDCIKMTEDFIDNQSEAELICGNWEVGRYAWKLENIRPVENIPIKGAQGLFNVDDHIIRV